MKQKTIGVLTAGGLAPCLSATIAELIANYGQHAPGCRIILYRDGFKGLLTGDRIILDRIPEELLRLLEHGGSCLGNSRIKLTNVQDCINRGLVSAGESPLERAKNQLLADNVDILHPIGGDDTNTTAIKLCDYLAAEEHSLVVVGLPKTIDNDIVPIRRSLGADTAAMESALFFENVVNEGGANPKTLVIHEIMGRHCGWLAAAAAIKYTERLENINFLPELGLTKEKKEIHALYLPESPFSVENEIPRLRSIIEKHGVCNLFVSEGANVDAIVDARTAAGLEIPRDAFGHVKLDKMEIGAFLGDVLGTGIGAEKILVQKSGYFARSAKPNSNDLALIKSFATLAVAEAMTGNSGVIGEDEAAENKLRLIEGHRISGGKEFNTETIGDRPFFLRTQPARA